MDKQPMGIYAKGGAGDQGTVIFSRGDAQIGGIMGQHGMNCIHQCRPGLHPVVAAFLLIAFRKLSKAPDVQSDRKSVV